MKRTDYASIAATYDESELRHDIPPDAFLGDRLSTGPRPFAVLDVGCGTGNWLAVQRKRYPEEGISWCGLDASPAMLDKARAKLSAGRFEVGSADALPFGDGSVHYLSCSFAFHHFPDKPLALDEMLRVLAAGGALRIANIVPEQMRRWWVYRFFPEAWLEDEKRFWSSNLLFHELARRGFEPRVEVTQKTARESLEKILEEASRRDVSELSILDDADYDRGMARLRAETTKVDRVVSESAVMVCTAIRA